MWTKMRQRPIMHLKNLCLRSTAFFLLFFYSTLYCLGCAKLAHLQELLTLKEFSSDRDQQESYIEKQDKNFEKLWVAVQESSMNQWTHRREFLGVFGKPILVSQVAGDDQQTLEKWLYRYASRPFGSPKVYVYFDREGKLVQWKCLPRDAGDHEVTSEFQKRNSDSPLFSYENNARGTR